MWVLREFNTCWFAVWNDGRFIGWAISIRVQSYGGKKEIESSLGTVVLNIAA